MEQNRWQYFFTYIKLPKEKMIIADRALRVIILAGALYYFANLHFKNDDQNRADWKQSEDRHIKRENFLEGKLMTIYDRDHNEKNSTARRVDSLNNVVKLLNEKIRK